MRGEVLGLERRRRWRDEDKVRIVASIVVGYHAIPCLNSVVSEQDD
jgi:hypothetical protein